MPRGFDTPREELDAGHEAWVERQERAASTPAPIATPEEVVDPFRRFSRHHDIIVEAIVAYESFMLDDDYDAQAALDRIIKQMRRRLAMDEDGQFLIAAIGRGALTVPFALKEALASSNAENERLREDLEAALAEAAACNRGGLENYERATTAERENASLTAQVGRMREALPMVRALLRIVWQTFDSGGESMRSQRSQALEAAQRLLVVEDDDLFASYRECDADPWAYITRARMAALSPTEPEGKT